MTRISEIVDATLAGDADLRRYRISIDSGRIARIAPMTEAGAAARADGEVLDAGGRAVLPGFVDAHAHVVEAGVERLRCDLSGSTGTAETIRRIRASRERLSSEWLVGRGWEEAQLPAELRSLRLVDELTGERPAYLNHANGHCAWVNSAALRRAGIDRATADPVGGRIGRHADGEPDGMLYESAMNLVNDLIPPLDEAQKRAGLLAGAAELHRFGVTAWQEAIVGPYVQTTDVVDVLRETIAAGEPIGRVNGALWWPRGAGAEGFDAVLGTAARVGDDPRFRATAVKIMLDGTAAHRSAAMLEPYLDGGDGELFFAPERLREAVRVADANGFDVHVHANGDRAVRSALDAIEAAMAANPPRERRHQLAHLNFVHPDDLHRFASLGVLAVVQPLWAQRSAKLVDQVLPVVAPVVRRRVYPFGSLRRAGAALAFSSDWPVSSPNPWPAMHTAVHRRNAESVDAAPLLPGEAVEPIAALYAATKGPAYVVRRDDEIGAVREGGAADLVVLDQAWGDATSQLDAVRVEATLIDGSRVYGR